MAVAFAGTLTVSAIPITGEISFDGTITFNNLDLASASTITSFVNPRVSSSTQIGSYASIADGTAVTFAQPINFTTFSGPLANLWKISSTGLDYSFDLNTLAVAFQGPGFLNLSGQGIARITGFDSTPGVWRLTAQEGNQRFSFSSSSAVTNVPETGSTVILMGLALLAVYGIQRKVNADKILSQRR